jgi:UDPglucose 6-dehydrogenase
LETRPEFTALGDIIGSMERPDFRLVGQFDRAAGDRLVAFVSEWMGDDAPVHRMDLTSAEMTKMVINAYVTNKMSFVNGLGRICEGVGADIDDVTDVMGADPRISEQYLTAGVRYGGPCFPHDDVAFDRLVKRAGVDFPLARGAAQINDAQTEWIAQRATERTADSGTIGIIGLTYKPNVPVVTESQGIDLLEYLAPEWDVIGYDRLGHGQARRELNEDEVWITDKLSPVISESDTVVVTLPGDDQIYDHSVYSDVTLVDPWRNFDEDRLDDSVTYCPLPP